MSNLLFRRKTAVVTLAAVAVLGGGVAFAYPPGTDLAVAASASPSTNPAYPNTTDVLVTVSNANPTCKTRVRVASTEAVLPAGTTSTRLYVAPSAGRNTVRARTVECARGQRNEHAKSTFVTLDAQATGNPTSPLRANYKVEITGLDPASSVTSTATLQGPTMTQLVESDDVDKRGEATVKFKLRTAGTWVITTSVSPSGAVNSVTVVVS